MKSIQFVRCKRVWEAGLPSLRTGAVTILLRLLTAQSQHVNLLMSLSEQERAPGSCRKTQLPFLFLFLNELNVSSRLKTSYQSFEFLLIVLD